MLDHGDHKKVDFSLFLVHFHPPHGSSYVTIQAVTSMSYIIYITDIMIAGSNCSLLVVGGHVYMTSSESAVTST